MASGANNTFRQVGIATGIAGLGTVFQTQIEHHTIAALGGTPAGQAVVAHGGAALQGALAGGGVREAMASIPSAASRGALLQAYRVGFSATLDHLMVIGALIAFIGSIASFALVRQRDFVPSFAPPPQSAAAPGRGPSLGPDRSSGSPVTTAEATEATEATAGPATGPARGPGRPRDQRASSAITGAALPAARRGGLRRGLDGERGQRGRRAPGHHLPPLSRQGRPDHGVHRRQQLDTPVAPASTDPRRDLIAYLTEFDERFAESCLEVVGTLIGSRENPSALAMHRQRVVEPRMGYLRSLLVTAVELGQLDPEADLDLALQMLAGSVFARRVAGEPSAPGWAERAVDIPVWVGMGGQGGPSARAWPPSARARG